MFCPNCGSELPNNAAFCQNCGTKMSASYAAADSAANPANAGGGSAPAPVVGTVKKPAISNKIIGIAAVCIAAVIALIVGVASFSGGYERTAEKYAEAYAAGSYDKMSEYLPLDLIKYMDYVAQKSAQAYEETVAEYWEDENYDDTAAFGYISDAKSFIDVHTAEAESEFTEEYGDAKVKAKAVGSYKMSENELNEIKEDLVSDYSDADIGVSLYDYCDVAKIKKAYKVTVHVQIDGDLKSDSETYTLVIGKVGGKWKMLVLVY